MSSVIETLDQADAGIVRVLTPEEWDQFEVMAQMFFLMREKGRSLPPEERTNQALLEVVTPEMRAVFDNMSSETEYPA